MGMAAGIDGCKAGWVVILWNGNNAPKCEILERFEDIKEYLEQLDVLAVDIPIGLPDKAPKGGRDCDKAARKLLEPPRCSSVFSPPSRAALRYPHNHKQASCTNGEVGLSKQSFHLIPKIKEVDELLRRHDCLRKCVFEVHPEVSFWAANGQQAMQYSKKKSAGRKERLKVLKEKGLDVEPLIQEMKHKGVSKNDMLDAAIAAWSAWRILKGEAKGVLPSPPEDKKGLEMQIYY